MKLKAFSPLLNGYETEAALTTDHAASSYGRPVLVIDNGDALGPADCLLADYRIIEASEDELAALDAAGYRLTIEGGAHG
ncbi:MAG: hypothetical protein U1D99_02750 [Candidatus Omnitrophota bacterium]|nr:hypothetical protein [Candidatus Omnitrophota bacterium]